MLVDIRAEQSEKNVLIFGTDSQYLGGFYVTDDDRITIATMCRWLSQLIQIRPRIFSEVELSFDELVSTPNCSIWSVQPCVLKLDAISAFAYNLDPESSSSVDSQSAELVEPGCYIISGPHPTVVYDIFSQFAKAPLRTGGLQQSCLDEQVRQRDKFCSITGNTIQNHDVSVTEIVQPSQWNEAVLRIQPVSQSDLNTPGNALLMLSNLNKAFSAYEFGIDVDDDYHIVQFTAPTSSLDLHGVKRLLLSANTPAHPRPKDILLKNHFYFCLQTRLSRASNDNCISEGDINDIESVLSGSDDLSNDEWASRIGQEILRVRMNQSFPPADVKHR